MAEDFIEPEPPDAVSVAKRALILSVIACRGFVDKQSAIPEQAKWAKDSANWLRALGMDEDLSAWERGILGTELGRLTDRDQVNASWLSEGLVVLAWALQRAEMPAYDVQCDPYAVSVALGFMKPYGETVLAKSTLRNDTELSEYSGFIYHLHWRIRDFSLFGRPYDFEANLKDADKQSASQFGLKLCDKDVKVGDGPLFRAAENERRHLASIVQERHRASNWLAGYGSEDFYEVPTDT